MQRVSGIRKRNGVRNRNSKSSNSGATTTMCLMETLMWGVKLTRVSISTCITKILSTTIYSTILHIISINLMMISLKILLLMSPCLAKENAKNERRRRTPINLIELEKSIGLILKMAVL